MSVYSCAHAIKEALKNGISLPNTFMGAYRPDAEEQDFLQSIRNLLNAIDASQTKIEDLARIINRVAGYKVGHPKGPLNGFLDSIENDLVFVRKGMMGRAAPEAASHAPLSPVEQAYKVLMERSLLTPLIQKDMTDRGIGNDGDCYGFTMSMADPALSPYTNPRQPVTYTRKIYNYQKNQQDRSKDQKDIKRTRLTTKTFSPSFKEQAEVLYDIAVKHPGKDLSVMLSSQIGMHATYLSLQDDGKIRYADPNHGVFLFNNKEEFLYAYPLIYQYQKRNNPDSAFHFFEVHQLTPDKGRTLSESKTLAGKWRSFLTGKKYGSDGILDTLIGAVCNLPKEI